MQADRIEQRRRPRHEPQQQPQQQPLLPVSQRLAEARTARCAVQQQIQTTIIAQARKQSGKL